MPGEHTAGLSRPQDLLTKAALNVPCLYPKVHSLLPPPADEAGGCWKELDPLLPSLPDVVGHLPPCLFLVAAMPKHCKILNSSVVPVFLSIPSPAAPGLQAQLLCTVTAAAEGCLCLLEFLSPCPFPALSLGMYIILCL